MHEFFNRACDHISVVLLFHVRVCIYSSACASHVCCVFAGRWRGGRTWLTLHVCQLLSSQVLGKQTTQSAYMLSALWATGSLQVHGALCLICCFDVCIKIISSLGVGVLREHWRPCKRNSWGAERVEWPSHPRTQTGIFFYAFFKKFAHTHAHCVPWEIFKVIYFLKGRMFFSAQTHKN